MNYYNNITNITSSTIGCYSPLVWPLSSPCSNHGLCLPSSSSSSGGCLCDSGWLSTSDYIFDFQTDCGMNPLIIVLLWSWYLFITPAVTILNIIYFISLVKAIKNKKSTRQS